MSDVRTFRAGTMQEALRLVRQELGAEAVILHTRQVAQRRLLPWRKQKQVVEITAGLEVNIRPSQARRRSKQIESATTPAGSVDAQVVSETPSASKAQTAGTLSASASRLGPPPTTKRAAALRNRLQSPVAHRSPVASPVARPDSTETIGKKLDSIQQMLENLGRNSRTGGSADLPSDLFQLYTELIDAEVEDDLARDLIFRLKQNGTPAQLKDDHAAKALLTALVESEIRCTAPIQPKSGQRKVVALVGPTGVGKTTTIAKLAANFRLRDGVKMGLVTVDTYRIAAVEQLRTYAEIIDLPMKVVTSPREMRRALDELAGLDLVLIDTAGRSPRDDLKIRELKSLIAEADVDEVHLVLSLTSSLRGLQATAEKFAAANTTSMILTKLDEAAGMGTLLSAARKIPLPISYMTTGQDVPDDIEPANASRIARLVLGQDQLFD